ncbi:SixA phosphatase family protein [Bifidobacterium favimelis]|uniref:Histidine phosphatase family protein n=1 Tax=Bifidobacterium favimelis TaxID=3122979 RepID=A0ABU8ZMZ5_9BIFI
MGVDVSKIAKHARRCSYTLILMRHAKAEVSSPDGDRGRPLTEKGLKQARKVAKGLVRVDLIPDRIVCSGALRARQTLDRMLAPLGDGPQVDYREDLYEGGIQAILDQMAQTRPDQHLLMIIGHEPAISVTSQWLAKKESDPGLLDLLNLGVSPANLVIFGSENPFDRWELHSARLHGVVAPHDFKH